ncbi:hypothetical protein ACRAWD_10995 [Caulobacter segnis]
MAREHEAIVTVEEGSMGGFGRLRAAGAGRARRPDRGLKIRTLCLPDVFQDQDKPDAMYAQGRPRRRGHPARRPWRLWAWTMSARRARGGGRKAPSTTIPTRHPALHARDPWFSFHVRA